MPTKRQHVRAEVIARLGRCCTYCGAGPLYRRSLHMDHILPRSVGGADTVDNLVPCCKACNFRKGDKPLDKYIEQRMVQLRRERDLLKAIYEELHAPCAAAVTGDAAAEHVIRGV